MRDRSVRPQAAIASLLRRLRELVDRGDVPLVGIDDRRVLAVLVDPAVDRPALAALVLVDRRRPVGPAGDAAKEIVLREGLADGVVLQQLGILQDGEIARRIGRLVHAILLGRIT